MRDGIADARRTLRILTVAQLDAKSKPLRVKMLIDTGATINVIRRSLVPSSFWTRAAAPRKLVTASSSQIAGGTHGVWLEFTLPVKSGPRLDQLVDKECRIRAWFYLADIQSEAIVSYGLLSGHDLAVLPAMDCLLQVDPSTTGEAT